ncbi:MAG: protein translocase subunit SecD [Planctomycetota bacterium]
MIENAGRQVILVVLVALASLYFIVAEKTRLGLDLKSGTQLVYELPLAELSEEEDPETVISETLNIIGERIDPTGVLDARITRRGERQFLVELPEKDKTESEIIKSQIQNLGKLEMRVLADAQYDEEGITFDNLADEKKRVEDWLNEDNNRQLVATDPGQIILYNQLPTEDGGRLDTENLVWVPGKIYPAARDRSRWDFAMSSRGETNVVGVYQQGELQAGPPTDWSDSDKPFLVELFPINYHEEHFEGEQMDASGVRQGNEPDSGAPCVFYKLAGEHATRYADWSSKYTGQHSAIILNGIVRSAPVFQGRIYGTGIIRGGFTEREAADLAKVIKTGSLRIKPTLISDVSIGAGLGARQIELGQMSILVGGALVLVFIIAYYRLAGLVAFAAIALNVFLILGGVKFIRATITLPGLAGLVLTMGMAVDANILIYERIREELGRGKDLMRAVRAGFDRAIVTILDANVTTFLAGLVLFNVGVGPVRGFAVMLMVGILSTLFTAYFVTRLVFHFLVTKNVIKDLQAATWLSGVKFDFLKIARQALAVSAIVVVGGLIYVFTVPNDKKLGLDFTGGANLEVVLKESSTAAELRNRLASIDAFRAEFPDPSITTRDANEDDRSQKFSIKLKLSDEMRERVAQEQRDAEAQGIDYEPPYKRQVRESLGPLLVAEAFTDIAANPLPKSTTDSAYVAVHLNAAVDLAAADTRIKGQLGPQAKVGALGADPDATTDRDFFIEFPVPEETAQTEIIENAQTALAGMTDAAGEPIQLSNPIPSAESIGPRMVGQLTTAAIGAMIVALFLIVMYIRVRFHEYKYGFAAVAALVHDVLVTVTFVVLFNHLGIVNAEIDLAMIAAFLTIIGYSINDTIVIFDRVRENASENARLGGSGETFAQIINRSINQTLSRTILTSSTTLFVVLAQFLVNYGTASPLEGFSFALIIGILSGTYSTIFIASPIVLWLRDREGTDQGSGDSKVAAVKPPDAQVAV